MQRQASHRRDLGQRLEHRIGQADTAKSPSSGLVLGLASGNWDPESTGANLIGPTGPDYVAIYVAISVPNRAGTCRSVPLSLEQVCSFTRECGAPGGIRTPDHLIRSHRWLTDVL